MKTTGLTNKLRSPLTLLLAAVLFTVAATVGQAQEPKIGARPLTPQEIVDNGLEGLHASGGLMTVGVGEPVYLEALVESGTVVNGVTWTIEKRPLAVPPSTAELQDSPLPAEMPLYSPGDRFVLDLAGRSFFVPDVAGGYTIQAVVATDSGSIVLTGKVTGAMYTGAGIIASDPDHNPTYPQCALCHPENAIGWTETGHATFFEEAVDGLASDHYSENCIECHVLGGHVPDAPNGNFFQTALLPDVNWTFPAVLQPGNWDAMPAKLQDKANIQCEHCHGAGSEHHGDITAISKSFNAGDCGQCHDSGSHHIKNLEWLSSTHSRVTDSPTGEGRGSCVKCHSAIGFVETLDGKEEVRTDYEAISCAACHDPHDASNHGQVRTVPDPVLEDGTVVSTGGLGKLCLQCHISRRNAVDYVEGNVSSHFGPHHGVQGDVVMGTNLIEYDGKVNGSPSAHMYAVENSCVGCHMQALAGDDPALHLAGGHTFKPTWDNGTPDDHSDDVDMVGACIECHGPMDTFDMPRLDYNLDGKIEGLQTEVHHLLDALAMYLPPKGQPVYEYDGNYEWTLKEKKALYNYLCVEEDGSSGIHNPRYATQTLLASINDLGDPNNAIFGGMNVPAGGPWFYSPWFEFYAPKASGWIYHFEHGYLWVSGDANKIYLYEHRTGVWRYTTPDVYPNMFDLNGNQWLYYGGRWDGNRYFYGYTSGEWAVIQ